MLRPRHVAQTDGPFEAAPARKKGCFDGETGEIERRYGGGERCLSGVFVWLRLSGERDLD